MAKLTHPSPNYLKGRSGQKPHTIVIHITDGSLQSATSWFQDPASGVSAHYVIGRNGEIRSFVKDEDTAWANGRRYKPTWRNIPADNINVNSVTISIEHEGTAKSVWTKAQKETSSTLIADICKKWNITPDENTVIGHYSIYALKPNCPSFNRDQKGIIPELIKTARKKL